MFTVRAASADQAGPYRVELPVFEGPLDLLLYLVRTHELDILDIPVAFVTERYLEYLDRMRGLSLDVSSEYLLMAATLAHLKSRELVPQPEPLDPELAGDEELDVDPRQQLIKRLLKYQTYKDAAERLGARPIVGRNVWGRGRALELVPAPNDGIHGVMEVGLFELVAALERVLAKSRVKLTHDVVVDRMSLTDRINALIDRLEREAHFTFDSCFETWLAVDGTTSVRYAIVVTFLAVLEMTRLKLIRVVQQVGAEDHEPIGTLHITRAAAPGTPVTIVDSYEDGT
jgi:segregation and condensation protein A